MQFLYPQFLYAFFTLLIPILIHLFYFRRFQTVYFSNVRFLSQLREEKQTRSRLKHWLTLLSRLLILTCLILAFAQPYIPNEASQNKSGKNAISIYLDNSYSMRSVGEEGSLIQVGKHKAREISKEYREADAFQLLTNDFKVPNQAFVSRKEFLPKVEEVESSPAYKHLKTVISRQTSLLRNQEAAKKVAFIIGDFQKSSTSLDNLDLDSTITYYFIPLNSSDQGNVYLDSAWLNAPTIQAGQNHRMQFRLMNTGDDPVEDLTTKLKINGQQKGLANITIPANGRDTGSVVFKINETGWNTGKLTIKDYPITFDDTYFLSYPVAKSVKILSVYQNQPNRYLNAAYKTDDYFELTNRKQGNLRYDNLQNYDLIILDQLESSSSGLVSEIISYTEKGGNLMLLPPAKKMQGKQKPYKRLLDNLNADRYETVMDKEQNVDDIQLSHPIFQNIFTEIPDNVRYPKVQKTYQQTQYSSAGARSLMTLQNGDPLLRVYESEKGQVFTSAIPMDGSWSNMPENALFVPLLYKIAVYKEQPYQLAYTIGNERAITLNRQRQSDDQVFKLQKGDFSFIPSQKMRGGQLTLFLRDQLKEAGIYKLRSNQPDEAESSEKPFPKFAFNYNRKESKLTTYSANTLQKAFTEYPNARVIKESYANIQQTLSKVQRGTFYWKYLLGLALGFLLIETLILKFLR